MMQRVTYNISKLSINFNLFLSTNNRAGKMMITDNNDILTVILLWLPAKSLIRFKLVCKKWFFLISSDHFSHLHTLHLRNIFTSERSFLLHVPQTPNYYFHLYDGKLVMCRFPTTLVNPTVASFANGLFLLTSRDSLADCYVYNPTTNQCKTIAFLDDKEVMGLSLAFSPITSPHYKIICVKAAKNIFSRGFLRKWRLFCHVEVYESEFGTWKLCGAPFTAPQYADMSHLVYSDNCVHWDGVGFDLEKNAIIRHPARPLFRGGNYFESEGHLHFMAHHEQDKLVEVYMLQSDYSQWSLKLRTNLERGSESLSVLSFIRTENGDDRLLVVSDTGKIMTYNIVDMTFKEMVDFKEDEFFNQEGDFRFVFNFTFQFLG